jgi:hypothetical protein
VKLIAVLLLGAIAMAAPPGSGVSQSLAQQRAGLLSDIRYGLSIELKPLAEWLRGREKLQFELKRVPADPLSLDFREGRIASVMVNGNAVTPDQSDGHILLPVSSLKTGANGARLEVRMVRCSFLVGLFHPRLHAGLSRRLRSLTVVAQPEGSMRKDLID